MNPPCENDGQTARRAAGQGWALCVLGLAALAAAQTGPVQIPAAGPGMRTGAATDGRAAPSSHAGTPKEAVFGVLGAYRDYYAEYEPLSFTAIAPGAPGAYGVRMAFGSNMPGFRHVEFAGEGKEFRILPDGVLFIPLDAMRDSPQEQTYRVRPVFSPQTRPATVRLTAV